jgi:hypothetical protein
LEGHSYPQAHWLRSVLHAAATVNAQLLVARGLQGEAIAQELQRRRIEAIKHLELKVDV